MRKPLLTKSVINGLADLLPQICVNGESQDQIKAAKYLATLVEYCRSPEYIARKREISNSTQLSKSKRKMSEHTEEKTRKGKP